MAIKSLAQKADETAQGVEETTSAGGAPVKKQSKAQSFDDVPVGSEVKDGKYEAILAEMILQEPKEGKGQSVRCTIVIASEDYRGEKITFWYKIFEDDKQEVAAGGAKFFKKTCATIGYPVTLDTIEEVCETVTNEKPGVLIQKKTNEGFDNVYINGLIEDSPCLRATYDGGFLN